MTKTMEISNSSATTGLLSGLEYEKATVETVVTKVNTLTGTEVTRFVPTSRLTGEIKLRIDSSEIPNSSTKSTEE